MALRVPAGPSRGSLPRADNQLKPVGPRFRRNGGQREHIVFLDGVPGRRDGATGVSCEPDFEIHPVLLHHDADEVALPRRKLVRPPAASRELARDGSLRLQNVRALAEAWRGERGNYHDQGGQAAMDQVREHQSEALPISQIIPHDRGMPVNCLHDTTGAAPAPRAVSDDEDRASAPLQVDISPERAHTLVTCLPD